MTGVTKKITFALLALGIVVLIFSGKSWYSNQNPSNVSQDPLLEACATAQIPQAELDTTLDEVQGIVTVRWWDASSQANIELQLPYRPETDFSGCSASAKAVLEHVRDARVEIP